MSTFTFEVGQKFVVNNPREMCTARYSIGCVMEITEVFRTGVGVDSHGYQYISPWVQDGYLTLIQEYTDMTAHDLLEEMGIGKGNIPGVCYSIKDGQKSGFSGSVGYIPAFIEHNAQLGEYTVSYFSPEHIDRVIIALMALREDLIKENTIK